MIHLSGAPGGGANHGRPRAGANHRPPGGAAQSTRGQTARAIGGRAADVRPATCRGRCCRRARRTARPESMAPSPERARAPLRFHSGRAAIPALGGALRRPTQIAPPPAGASVRSPAARPWRSVQARHSVLGQRSAPVRCWGLEQRFVPVRRSAAARHSVPGLRSVRARLVPASRWALERTRGARPRAVLRAAAAAWPAASAAGAAARRCDRLRDRDSVPSWARAGPAPAARWRRRAAEYASPAGQPPSAASPAPGPVRAAVPTWATPARVSAARGSARRVAAREGAPDRPRPGS